MGALHFHPQAYGTKPQAVKWILFAISAMCQIFDGMITNNTIANQTPFVKAIFENVVPAIPAFIFMLLLWIGKLPESDEPRKPSLLEWMRQTGLRHSLDGLKEYWEGQGKVTNVTKASIQTLGMEIKQPELAEKTKNPTSGSNGTH